MRRTSCASTGRREQAAHAQGWLEFHPTDKSKPVLRTAQETSQPNYVAIEYWAFGLEPIYLEGALARAQGRLPAPSSGSS
jgi:hypothetical protein